MEELKFPENFLWGAATSAHQVEGNNHNDWTEWEKKNATKERLEKERQSRHLRWQQEKFAGEIKLENFISGRACDHYNRYEEDFVMAKSWGHNAHRFSIEWSRIEPREGEWDYGEVEHYRQVLKTLKRLGFTTFVTLWHWTNPVWLADKGGWANKKVPFYFSRYAEFIAKNLGEDIDFFMTLNEPMVPLAWGYLTGSWPPSKKIAFLEAGRVFRHCVRAHKEAYVAIRGIIPEAKIGLSMLFNCWEPANKWNPLEILIAKTAEFFHQNWFCSAVKNQLDFLGIHYYFHDRIVWYPPFKKNLYKETTDMGWEIYPQGIYRIIKRVCRKYKKPVYITENGLADAQDIKREKFIRDHLFWIYKAIEEGNDVRGYLHWSLLDNFEWSSGFYPRFGLAEVDFNTLERRPRKSVEFYADICRNNRLKTGSDIDNIL